MARPPLYTPARANLVIDAVRAGLSYKLAAHRAGVSYDTLNRWRRAGDFPGASPELCGFCERLRQAEAQAAERHVSNIEAAGQKDWKAAAWFLERRFPEDFGRAASNTDPLNPFEGLAI